MHSQWPESFCLNEPVVKLQADRPSHHQVNCTSPSARLHVDALLDVNGWKEEKNRGGICEAYAIDLALKGASRLPEHLQTKMHC